MSEWEILYNNIKKYKIPIIECLDDYYMIFYTEIMRCNSEVYGRYKYYLESDDSITPNKAKISKLRMGVELAYNQTNKELWKDLKEFIQKLDEDNIRIANESCIKLINRFILKDESSR